MSIKHIIKIVSYASHDYNQVVALRETILRKPLGLSFSKKDLAIDKGEIIIGLFTQNKCIACVQMRHVNTNEVKLRQMAVDQMWQGKGMGSEILQYAERIAMEKNYKEFSLHARKTAFRFYEKLGFTIIGNEFIEVGIPHYGMQKKL